MTAPAKRICWECLHCIINKKFGNSKGRCYGVPSVAVYARGTQTERVDVVWERPEVILTDPGCHIWEDACFAGIDKRSCVGAATDGRISTEFRDEITAFAEQARGTQSASMRQAAGYLETLLGLLE